MQDGQTDQWYTVERSETKSHIDGYLVYLRNGITNWWGKDVREGNYFLVHPPIHPLIIHSFIQYLHADCLLLTWHYTSPWITKTK